MPSLDLRFASGDSLSVRRFAVHEGVSRLFTVTIWAASDDASIDLDTLVGKPASFHASMDASFTPLGGERWWAGLCEHAAQVKIEPNGKSTYQLRIVPRMWLLTQRRGHRIFQHANVPDIVAQLLDEWSVPFVWSLDRAKYPKLEYRSQYGETDYDFVCRLLEEAGITFAFLPNGAEGPRLTIDDAPHARARRGGAPLSFTDNPSGNPGKEVAIQVRLAHDVRPGAHTIRDYDFRKPAFALLGNATKASAPEDRYEHFEYLPGGFHVAAGGAGDTPSADDKGIYRHDAAAGEALAQRSLEGERVRKRAVTFATNTIDVWPGAVLTIGDHPNHELAEPLFVTGFSFDGAPGEAWNMSASALFASLPYRPSSTVPKPSVHGVQSATVVGPVGQEIYTDETGRVRVQFPWDRDGRSDDWSSAWMRVSQEWAGAGYGMITLPRVGQEVLVSFLDGDPDQPVVVGRLFNVTHPVPYKLPDNKTRSTIKTNSSPEAAGYNEILLEDLAGGELVYQQAQKNLRRLVKNDETITVVKDRWQGVEGRDVDTTIGKRTELTSKNRIEEVSHASTTVRARKSSTLVKHDEIERTLVGQMVFVAKDDHTKTGRTRHELVTGDFHHQVQGAFNESLGGYSLSTWSQQEKIGKKNELETGLAIHEKAGTVLIAEGNSSVTIKGPGGFIFIDGSGVTIEGTLVLINAGGSPGSAPDAKPAGAEKPQEATVTEPPEPPLPDVLGAP